MSSSNPKITVFTPCYNRGKTIRNTYESLCRQKSYDFEWLVINDGSNDNSHDVISDIVLHHNAPFSINYINRSNYGLMYTINEAVLLSKGQLFFRLDSDDYATDDAIETILKYFPKIFKENLCGITFLSLGHNKKVNGYHPFHGEKICDFTSYRAKYKGTGDRAEVCQVEILKKYPYPQFPNEKFCPEGLIWNRIANDYMSLYIPHPIYVKSFPDDSITSSIYSVLRANCYGTTQYYFEIVTNKRLPVFYRLINCIKYYRYAIYTNKNLLRGIPLWITIMTLPIALGVIIRDKLLNK